MQARWSCLGLAAFLTALSAGCARSGDEHVRVAPSVDELTGRLGHARWRVRAAAAESLGGSRDIRALWPLTLAAATDPHPRVRLAAAEAITWLGPEPNSAVNTAFRRVLLERTPSIRYEGLLLKDAMQDLGGRGGTSWHVDLGSLEQIGVYHDHTKVTVDARDLTLAEAWCRVLVATGKEVSFLIDPPIHVASVQSLIRHEEALRDRRARRKELRRLGQQAEAGRDVHRKLRARIREARFEFIEFSTALEWISQVSNLRVRADWEKLEAVGILRTAVVKNVDAGPVTLEELLWLVLDDVGGATPLEFIVKEGGVFISTRAEIDKWLAAQRGKSE